MKEVFKRLREAGLKVHPGKCVFASDSIDFLGHRILDNSLRPQEDKLSAMKKLPAPIDVSSLRAALGLFSYYHKFVYKFSSIAFPLNRLLKKEAPWEWSSLQQETFAELKEQLYWRRCCTYLTLTSRLS